VLYSERDACWKITDFGTATEATSKHFNTTRYPRGTACYRAPELIREDPKYNNKVDIWALGCILYEISTGYKLFSSDFAVLECSSAGAIKFPVAWVTPDNAFVWNNSNLVYGDLFDVFKRMLQLTPLNRPKAGNLELVWLTAILDFQSDYMPEMNPYWAVSKIKQLDENLRSFGLDSDRINEGLLHHTPQQVRPFSKLLLTFAGSKRRRFVDQI
jgi:serine/threonine protein kinase